MAAKYGHSHNDARSLSSSAYWVSGVWLDRLGKPSELKFDDGGHPAVRTASGSQARRFSGSPVRLVRWSTAPVRFGGFRLRTGSLVRGDRSPAPFGGNGGVKCTHLRGNASHTRIDGHLAVRGRVGVVPLRGSE